jgi:3-phosphoshikimate 1-carboxyvinyltransferase
MNAESLILSGKNKRQLSEVIRLTGSKSESNRALILQAISNGKVQVHNLSSAADTVVLNNIFNSELNDGSVVDIGPAGPAMRFLTAYFAVNSPADIILTGSERMKQRPIGILADALRSIGARIDYTEQDGFPPIKIYKGFIQKTKRVKIRGNISSQYISALLMIAPALPGGLEVEIEGELTSRPYVSMTLSLLEQTGITHQWKDNLIIISNQSFNPSTITVEPDWSAASYWYSIAALCEQAEIRLPYLKKDSLQGDSRIAEIMEDFGVRSVFDEEGVTLIKQIKQPSGKMYDFKDCPDLAQTVIVCCAALGHDATFTGLETLKIKETDRVRALQNELAKIGVRLLEEDQVYNLDCSQRNLPEKLTIHTYDDHRMAMAFAPLALVIDELEIEDPNVVEKSYPHFWDDLKKAGFKMNINRKAQVVLRNAID